MTTTSWRSGEAVEFYWNTKLPVEIAGRVVTITGRRGQATLTAPADCAVRVEELPLLDGEVQRRIAFRKGGPRRADRSAGVA